MIEAVGVDIADVKRIKNTLERWGDRFVSRTFSVAEAEYCRRHRDEALRFAARFAAKEAFIKCLGSARGIRWSEIELLNDRSGKPLFRLSDGIRLGWATGFDSGRTLDYVYENRPRGRTPHRRRTGSSACVATLAGV